MDLVDSVDNWAVSNDYCGNPYCCNGYCPIVQAVAEVRT